MTAKRTKPVDLSAKREAFVRAYVAYGNATQAAIAAGYSEKTAKQQGSRLLTDVDIQAAIEDQRAPIMNHYEVTAERVIAELSKIAFSSMGDLMEVDADGNPQLRLDGLTDQQKAAIAEFQTDSLSRGEGTSIIKVKVKMHDKLSALEKLGRQLGMFGGKAEDDRNNAEAAALREMLMRAQGTALPIKPSSGGKK